MKIAMVSESEFVSLWRKLSIPHQVSIEGILGRNIVLYAEGIIVLCASDFRTRDLTENTNISVAWLAQVFSSDEA